MHPLTELIRQDMRPALGVTEPGAIAFAAATARRHTRGTVQKVRLRLNSGMYKNAFTCGIPGSSEVGNAHAAALGALAADPDKGLECLDGITADQAARARALVAGGHVEVALAGVTSRIFIEAEVTTDAGCACVTIRDAHTNIVRITEDGRTVFEQAQPAPGGGAEEGEGETPSSTATPSRSCGTTPSPYRRRSSPSSEMPSR